MGEKTDAAALIRDLNKAVPLMARDALAAALTAGTLGGLEGVTLAERLREFAADQLRDLERIAGRIVTLGGSPRLSVESMAPETDWRAAVDGLVSMQRETLDVLVAAIAAGADDAEGEATEHLLEHVITRTRDAIELLERAAR
jgi:bacterioferritin (cytochrome b1)